MITIRNLTATTQECWEQYWTSPGDNTPRDANCTATCLPSRKLYRLDEPDTPDTAGDELVSDVLLWTPTYGQAKAGRPAWTYIQQLCEDTGCNPEDLPEAMNDREKWRERVRDIRASGTTWWWWWYIHLNEIYHIFHMRIFHTHSFWTIHIYIYIYIYCHPQRDFRSIRTLQYG